MSRFLPTSLGGRFLLVLAGALLPLGLAGWWLTAAGANAAEDLLQSQLEASAASLAHEAERDWTDIRGDFLLLAENEVAVRTLAGGRATRADTSYMHQLLGSARQRIPFVGYRGKDDRARWQLPGDTVSPTPSQAVQRASIRFLPVSVPVIGPAGDTVGTVVAQLDLDRALGLAQRTVGVFDASLAVVDLQRNAELLGAPVPRERLDSARFFHNDATWLTARRTLERARLLIIVGAPTTSYVAPYRAAARVGLSVLAFVFILVAIASAFITRRLTTSLADLATTASAVAQGDLEREARGGGAAEIDRVAAAFNAMSARLRATIAELSHRQSLAAVGQFASALSHEVRNALTAVRVDLQRAQERLPASNDAAPIVNRALENTLRLDSSVTGALRIARASRLERTPVNVQQVIDQAVRSAEPTVTGRNLRLSVDSGVESKVLGDSIALQQLLLNLILNAAQASPAGGEIRVSATNGGRDLTIAVEDDGTGVAPEHVERIMDPFFSTKVDGTGLGLSIARQIAISHGGELQLTSEQGRGTTVRVRLPALI